MESLIDSVRTFLLGCPYLKDGVFNVDYLGGNPTEYTVDTIPADNIIKQYVDGSSVRQFVFAFGSVELYGSDVDNNLANSTFYEDFAAWMDEKSRNRELPNIGADKSAIEIKAQGAGYVVENTENAARYQVQCRLIYTQKG
ncbi:hypothetical protein [Anaerotignum sp. MB30-C6]|uniref:hypothetical protein n=1 Tax=Anaerotignum sp. MB30-C6 TaxID=3070814 RepID=UPI0027DEAB81|nr:hypothetical protein [Anaerotignum sp. MB30-C6]WMI81944.1 hypothetical protein RBQ60_04220 [Anaerotignum sp. MB30-C6]